MIPQAHRADPFKEQLRESLQRETYNSCAFKIAGLSVDRQIVCRPIKEKPNIPVKMMAAQFF